MSEELVREARERAEKASELVYGGRAAWSGDGCSFSVYADRLADFAREDVPALCDALEEANERIRELEEQVQTYMEFPYTMPKQR